jgi:hypothetical protein
LLCGVLFLACAAAAPLAPEYPPEATLTFTPMPAGVPLPEYLVPYLDPVCGTQVTRVADHAGMGSNQTVLAHHYAKDQPWNSDGTLIQLSGWPSAILDGRTYAFLRWIMPPGDHHVWSNTDPKRIYGIQQRHTWEWVDAGDGAVHPIRTFAEYTHLSLCEYEGNLSNDDRYAVFQATAPSGNWVLVYDMQQDSVLARLNSGALYPNNVTMSQSGNYVAIQWDVPGYGERAGIGIYPRDLSFVRNVGSCGGCHYDLGYDTEGHEVAVLTDIDQSSRAIIAVRLEDGTRTTLLTDAQMSWYIHVSCRALNRPGWAYLSEFADPNTQTTKPNYQLAFAVRIDGSGTVERFAQVHHSATVEYERAPFAVPNRDGDKMMFRSDWENGAGPVYSYVAAMPDRR